MSTPDSQDVGPGGRLRPELVDDYRRDGFVRVRGILHPEEVERYSAAEQRYCDLHRDDSLERAGTFTQLVNVWRSDDTIRQLTLHDRIAAVAEQLAGIRLRLWHDHMLVKEPHNEKATHFHQDRPFWPHADDEHSLSCRVALVDVPPERGCMTFLPGTQHRTGLRPQDLREEEDLFGLDPELRWQPRITVPLRAGDCTFHNSYTGHMALPNSTDLPRFAHVTIFMDARTRFDGRSHPVTRPLDLTAGDKLDTEMFPLLPAEAV